MKRNEFSLSTVIILCVYEEENDKTTYNCLEQSQKSK